MSVMLQGFLHRPRRERWRFSRSKGRPFLARGADQSLDSQIYIPVRLYSLARRNRAGSRPRRPRRGRSGEPARPLRVDARTLARALPGKSRRSAGDSWRALLPDLGILARRVAMRLPLPGLRGAAVSACQKLRGIADHAGLPFPPLGGPARGRRLARALPKRLIPRGLSQAAAKKLTFHRIVITRACGRYRKPLVFRPRERPFAQTMQSFFAIAKGIRVPFSRPCRMKFLLYGYST